MKNQEITEITRIHPMGTTKACTKKVTAIHPINVEIFRSKSTMLMYDADVANNGSTVVVTDFSYN